MIAALLLAQILSATGGDVTKSVELIPREKTIISNVQCDRFDPAPGSFITCTATISQVARTKGFEIIVMAPPGFYSFGIIRIPENEVSKKFWIEKNRSNLSYAVLGEIDWTIYGGGVKEQSYIEFFERK